MALSYRLGRIVCNRSCAGLTACLIALHPLPSWYAAEARMYVPVQLISLVDMVASFYGNPGRLRASLKLCRQPRLTNGGYFYLPPSIPINLFDKGKS